MSKSKEYLDGVTSQLFEGKLPDFWIVHKTQPPHNQVVGTAIAVYRKKESLYENFDNHVEETDPRYGITVGVYWFDD